MFESHAEYLGSEMFEKFSLSYLRQISLRVKEKLKEEGLEVVPMVS